MASSGGLVVVTLAGHPSVVGIYVLLAVSSAFAAIDSPTAQRDGPRPRSSRDAAGGDGSSTSGVPGDPDRGTGARGSADRSPSCARRRLSRRGADLWHRRDELYRRSGLVEVGADDDAPDRGRATGQPRLGARRTVVRDPEACDPFDLPRGPDRHDLRDAAGRVPCSRRADLPRGGRDPGPPLRCAGSGGVDRRPDDWLGDQDPQAGTRGDLSRLSPGEPPSPLPD